MPHDQRETPYLDATLRYRSTGYTPFHTPGHKLGKGAPDGLRRLMGDAALAVDLAMAGGVEDTRESTHLVRLAEDYAAEAWGADRAWFLVNGSTSGIHSLLLTLCGPGDAVIVPRNAHKSLLAGLIFTGATPVYMEPVIDSAWGIPLQVSSEDARAAIERAPHAKAVLVTSPTYNGLGAERLAKVREDPGFTPEDAPDLMPSTVDLEQKAKDWAVPTWFLEGLVEAEIPRQYLEEHQSLLAEAATIRFLREVRALAGEHRKSVHVAGSAAAGHQIIRLTQCRNGLIELRRSVGRYQRVAARSVHG